MRFNLAAMIRRASNPRRSQIILRPIIPTSAQAASLYAAAYRPVIAAWQGAVERIAATYERSIPVRDAIHDSIFDLDAIFAALEGELSRIVLSITPVLKEWAVAAEKVHRGKWRGAVLTASGIDLDTILLASGEPQTVAETIAWNVALVKDVSAQAQARMSSAVFAAYRARVPARELAKELQGIVGMSRRRALGIAADQSSKISGSLDKERMAQAGIDKFKYRSSHKLHARPWHAKRDQHIYELVSGKEVDGSDVIEPGDGPSEPPWCGCRRQAVITI